MQKYFTDRENGARPRNIDVIDQCLWEGLNTLIEIRIGNDSFGVTTRPPDQGGGGRVDTEFGDKKIRCKR